MADTKEPRSTDEIEADLAASRDRLSRTVDELAFRASPAELKRRGMEKVDAKKAELRGKLEDKKAELTGQADGKVRDEHGSIRLDLVAYTLGAVAGVTFTLGLARRVFYRG